MDEENAGGKGMSRKRFDVELSLSELYAIRNALRETGKEPDLLTRIEKKIARLHDFFDGRVHHLALWTTDWE